jgi:hypothetical protein
MRNEAILRRVKEERNILHTKSRRKAIWIGHILLRNCLLKYVIEGKIRKKIKLTGRGRRRYEQLLDDPKENRQYWQETGSSGSQSLEYWLWKRLWTCRKTDYRMRRS